MVTQLSSVFSYWNYIIAFATVVLFYLFSRFVVVRPVQKLTNAAMEISSGNLDVDLGIKDTQEKSRNEITKLAFAFEKLRNSYKFLAGRMANK